MLAFIVAPILTVEACGGASPAPYGQPWARQASPTATQQAITTPKKTTPSPNKQTSYPVCNQKVTTVPCVMFGSIQEAAVGESEVGAIVSSGIRAGVVWVRDDITNVSPPVFGPPTSLDEIQLQCFNIQQGLWYGLQSTINADGTQTIRKSAFSEVDVTFFDQHIGSAAFASCRLTSAGADRLDKAGMWDDGDYRGAWAMYDRTSYE